MSVNEEALSLPQNPMSAQATVGKDYLLYVAGIVSPATTESFYIIGGQTGGSIDESTDEIDVTNKTSGGYKAALAGLTSWSIDFDAIALLPGSDTGVEILKRAKAQKTQVKVKILYPDGSYRIGWATSTTYTVDTPHDKDATLKGKLSGYGPLSDQSVTVDKSEATDQNFYFSNTSLATGITLNSTKVDAGNFTTAKGTVTLKGNYLATLDAGEYLFYVSLNTGGYSLVAVTITGTATLNPAISPTSATFSKASATDATFTVTPSSTTLASVKNASTSLTSGTDYTYSAAGTLTIKSSYLSAQTNGTVTLTVTPTSGSTMTLTITVGA